MNARLLLTLSTVLVVVALLLGASRVGLPVDGPVEPQMPAAEQAPAPDFALETLAGQHIALRDLRGRWVLVNFWATWCIPCREEMPYLQSVADQHSDRLTVLAVNMRESAAVIQPFAAEFGLRFPILVAPDDTMLLAYQVLGVPLTVVIAPDGRLVHRQIGPLQAPDFDRWLTNQLQ